MWEAGNESADTRVGGDPARLRPPSREPGTHRTYCGLGFQVQVLKHFKLILLSSAAGSEMCSGSEAGSYLRLIDSCITHLKAQGTSRTCNESKEEERDLRAFMLAAEALVVLAVLLGFDRLARIRHT